TAGARCTVELAPKISGREPGEHRFDVFVRASNDRCIVSEQAALAEIAAFVQDARVAQCRKQFHVFAFLDAKNSNSDHTRAFRSAGTAHGVEPRVYARFAGRSLHVADAGLGALERTGS